ncbi:MAG: hypothetical protein JWO05_2853 [Gemmatimonadetes bacterium]|nr:hypothetical protein [Gemmatimonadota bacterium]
MRAAQIQADQMAASHTLTHHVPKSRYPRLQDRLHAVGYHWRATAENVGSGYPNAAAVVTAWMNSPGHSANMVSHRFTQAGAGVATDSNGVRYWVLVFGTPL